MIFINILFLPKSLTGEKKWIELLLNKLTIEGIIKDEHPLFYLNIINNLFMYDKMTYYK